MKQIILLDHAATQGQRAAERREADFDAANKRYAAAIAARVQKASDLRERSRSEFQKHRYFSWLLSFFPRIAHSRSARPKAPRPKLVGRDEAVWNAGRDGEQRVADVLARFLSDDWSLLSGYRNKGGEVDQILVGPKGILALEIKFINGKVYCDGDKWWRDKYDRYGNLVETGLPIADKGGRGPSVQVNAAADRLQEFLAKRTSIREINRAVIFSHDGSELRKVSNQTVHLVATLDYLNVGVIEGVVSGGLSGVSVERVVELIRKDHAFHAQPRKRAQGIRSSNQRKGGNNALPQRFSRQKDGRAKA